MTINHRFPGIVNLFSSKDKRIYRNKTLRKIIIPLLKRINPGKVSIKHHYTKNRFVLDLFMHKGYWYHGKAREANTMNLFKALINPGMTVVEVGGHIGYITNYFSRLVAESGNVYVFEPGVNNLPYLKENIQALKNVTLVTKAVSDNNGSANFYIENLSGQNNSLLSDYGTTSTVHKLAFVEKTENLIQVETITLDSFCQQSSVIPDFIKIDIEGAELLALGGMDSVLQQYSPIMMIEVTENWKDVAVLLEKYGYKLYNDELKQVDQQSIHRSNTFCLHTTKHEHIIKSLPVEDPQR